MRFSSLPVEEAEGALLAHTLRLPGRVLKKGRPLEPRDIEDLLAEGQGRVFAAVLEAGDVAEDEAAERVARAFAGSGVTLGRAFTGRCNLYARERGLVVIDRERADQLNRIDESVTVATLPPFAFVEEGVMVATVKVIPFSVPGEVLARCEKRIGSLPPLDVAPIPRREAAIVLTELSGTQPKLIRRASESLRRRLSRLGAQVAREVRCAHDPDGVAEALRGVLADGCDPVLMLGASAIVDRRDVLPTAVERVGGVVEHLGMPVDPGNLLMLARKDATRIIGVPGCARSPKPSGFDWVLERVVAGLDVGGDDIMGMGVGGLLLETPSRPQPREPEAEARERAPRVACVVLAGGRSRRMGDRNKLLCEVEGRPMVARVVDAALASRADSVLVVTGHEAEAVREALRGCAVSFAHNPDFAEGMSTSLRAGIAALGSKVDGALVCLGDMPWVEAEHFDALIGAFDPTDDRGIYVPVHKRKRGNPVLWHRRYFDELATVTGDQGGRSLLDRHADEVCLVPISSDAINVDIDTPEALADLREAEERG